MEKKDNKEITSPLKAIREKCLDCCCWSESEVRLCTAVDCALYYFRMGKNNSPKHKKKELTDEQREAMRKNFEKNVLKKES
jgi:hypothetical protein